MKILFNRESIVVRCLEAIGVLFSAFYYWKNGAHFGLTAALYTVLFVSYLFVRICDLISWYPIAFRGTGIEVHFRKALVPTSYILAVASVFVFLNVPYLSAAVIAVATLMMLMVAPVNGILIYFHLRDKDPLPINYFSQNHYQEGTNPREKLQTSVG